MKRESWIFVTPPRVDVPLEVFLTRDPVEVFRWLLEIAQWPT